jgi:hypothetical protein
MDRHTDVLLDRQPVVAALALESRGRIAREQLLRRPQTANVRRAAKRPFAATGRIRGKVASFAVRE